MTEALEQLARNIAVNAGSESARLPVDRNYIKSNLPLLNKTDRQEFIIINCRIFDRFYSAKLLLCAPELWSEFTTQDWLSVVRGLGPRPHWRDFFDTGCFNDVLFLFRWIKVDPFRLILSDPSITDWDKLSIITYFLTNMPFVFEDHSAALERYELAEIEVYLQRSHQNLIKERPDLEQTTFDRKGFILYFGSLYVQFGGDASYLREVYRRYGVSTDNAGLP